MRIISGKHKGKRIQAPKNLPVRPTTDMAKEALFNILNNHYYFDGIKVLDLFSGTGNIAYEFASRGTENITAVDAHFGCIKFLNATAEKLDCPIKTVKADVYKFLEKHPLSYDIIFADPPYDFEQNQFEKIIDLVFTNNLVAPDGLLILEHSAQNSFAEYPKFSYDRKYGGNFFSFFENENEE